MKWIALLPPFALPPLIHWIYQPINVAWTVKRFGCGCPPLDLSWRFNANHFNSILWLTVLTICGSWLVVVGAKCFRQQLSVAVGGGLPFVAVMCLWFCVREMWM